MLSVVSNFKNNTAVLEVIVLSFYIFCCFMIYDPSPYSDIKALFPPDGGEGNVSGIYPILEENNSSWSELSSYKVDLF